MIGVFGYRSLQRRSDLVRVIVSFPFSQAIYDECSHEGSPTLEFKDLELIADNTPLPPDVVVNASQQMEPVAPLSPVSVSASNSSASDSSTSDRSASDRSPSDASESSPSESDEGIGLRLLGSYRMYPASHAASSIPICLGMVMTQQTVAKLGGNWDETKVHWFNWNTERFQKQLKAAITSQILLYEKRQRTRNEEASSEEDGPEEGKKRKRADTPDAPAAKRFRPDIDDLKNKKVSLKVSSPIHSRLQSLIIV